MSPAPSSSPDSDEVLNGRYRVDGLVARGGMARVHEGHDLRLDRTVALKIMHPHLAEDPQFVARFTREARAVAKLSHPRIVSVFDQGEDDGRVYLAMELVRGTTLRNRLLDDGAMTPRESIGIACDVLEALEHAHEAGIIHRDIKPENILLDQAGRAKVADFGLARAVGAAHSSASGTLLGTVAYISPEVVTRGHADERSDLYSLGIVLYEMLTGSQPYTGELPVHIAFQHVHEDIPAPSLRNAAVPPELDSIVTWCCQREPRRRPASASVLLAAMRDLLTSLGPAALDARPQLLEPSTSTGEVPAHTAVLDDDALFETPRSRRFPALLGGAAATGADRADAADGSAGSDAADGAASDAGSGGSGGGPRLPWADGSEGNDGADEEPEPRTLRRRAPRTRAARHSRATHPPRGRRGLRGAAIVLVLALIGGGAWAGERWYELEGPGAERTVPVLAGTRLTDAEAALGSADLETRTQETFSEDVPKGHVVSLSPAAGSAVRRGDRVTLLVSKGVQTFAVPDLKGLTADDARQKASAAHLELVEADPEYDAKVPKGQIISQSADAPALPAGGQVTVVVSRGPQPVAVPDVRGRTKDDAIAALRAHGLLASTAEAFSSSTPAGKVSSQRPAGGTAAPGSTIALTISKGPEMVTVPNTFRKSEADAVAAVKAAGLTPKVVHDKGTPAFGLVYQQDPAGGSAAKGSVVTLHVF